MSNRARLEFRVLQVLDALVNNQQTEDSAVELKAEWPKPEDAYDTARQLAGHANAARGEPILWIIGANQRKREVWGAAPCEVKSWYEPHRKHFDGEIIPGLLPELVVPYGDKSVVALPFDTSRAPYLIKVPHTPKLNCQFEVPYRIGMHTNTARRQDLLRILVQQTMVPIVDVLNMTAKQNDRDSLEVYSLLYIATADGGRIVIPKHKCKIEIRRTSDTDYLEPPGLSLNKPTNHDVVIDGGTHVELSCTLPIQVNAWQGSELTIRIEIGVAMGDITTSVECRLAPNANSYRPTWRLKGPTDQ